MWRYRSPPPTGPRVADTQPSGRRDLGGKRDPIQLLRLIAEPAVREVQIGVQPEPGCQANAPFEIQPVATGAPARLRRAFVPVVDQLALQVRPPKRCRQGPTRPVMTHAELDTQRPRD